jgi:hypothetical protein
MIVCSGIDCRSRRLVTGGGVMMEAERLRKQADLCMRMARGTVDRMLAGQLVELASQYLDRARALEGQPQTTHDDET